MILNTIIMSQTLREIHPQAHFDIGELFAAIFGTYQRRFRMSALPNLQLSSATIPRMAGTRPEVDTAAFNGWSQKPTGS
jgi:hypothetical protein